LVAPAQRAARGLTMVSRVPARSLEELVEAGWADALANLVRTVIFDEVQELRHSGTNKYDAAAAIGKATALRIGLSATPIYNYGAEIYSVLDAIGPGRLGTRKEFYDEWCGGANPGSDKDARKVCVADPVALGTYLREAGLMIRRTRKEVGRELPALTVVRHAVDVDSTRINEAVASVAELARRVLERTGTNFDRMQAAGEIDYRMRQATGIGKAAAVVDFVRLLVDAGERVVLYGWHHEVYALWRSALQKHGVPFAMYTGDESETAKAEAVKRFCAPDFKTMTRCRSSFRLHTLHKESRAISQGHTIFARFHGGIRECKIPGL